MPLRVILPRLWESIITAMTQLVNVLSGQAVLLYSVVYPYSVWGSLFCGGNVGKMSVKSAVNFSPVSKNLDEDLCRLSRESAIMVFG